MNTDEREFIPGATEGREVDEERARVQNHFPFSHVLPHGLASSQARNSAIWVGVSFFLGGM